MTTSLTVTVSATVNATLLPSTTAVTAQGARTVTVLPVTVVVAARTGAVTAVVWRHTVPVMIMTTVMITPIKMTPPTVDTRVMVMVMVVIMVVIMIMIRSMTVSPVSPRGLPSRCWTVAAWRPHARRRQRRGQGQRQRCRASRQTRDLHVSQALHIRREARVLCLQRRKVAGNGREARPRRGLLWLGGNQARDGWRLEWGLVLDLKLVMDLVLDLTLDLALDLALDLVRRQWLHGQHSLHGRRGGDTHHSRLGVVHVRWHRHWH